MEGGVVLQLLLVTFGESCSPSSAPCSRSDIWGTAAPGHLRSFRTVGNTPALPGAWRGRHAGALRVAAVPCYGDPLLCAFVDGSIGYEAPMCLAPLVLARSRQPGLTVDHRPLPGEFQRCRWHVVADLSHRDPHARVLAPSASHGLWSRDFSHAPWPLKVEALYPYTMLL